MNKKQKNKKKKRWYEDEDDEGEEKYKEKSVGLIVERTFRDSNQPLTLLKYPFSRPIISKADQIFRHPVHLSESLTKLIDRPTLSTRSDEMKTRRWL